MTTFTRESDEIEVPRGFDNHAILAEARRNRDEAIAGVLVSVGRGIATLWRAAIVGPFLRWQERERTYRELSMLNEHELQDIGITSGMIPLVVAGKVNAANENRRSTKAA